MATNNNDQRPTSPQPSRPTDATSQQGPQPLAHPNPIVTAGIKYRKEVILLVCVLIAFGIYALKVMNLSLIHI